MTVYLDTSALVGLHLDGPARAVVLATRSTATPTGAAAG